MHSLEFCSFVFWKGSNKRHHNAECHFDYRYIHTCTSLHTPCLVVAAHYTGQLLFSGGVLAKSISINPLARIDLRVNLHMHVLIASRLRNPYLTCFRASTTMSPSWLNWTSWMKSNQWKADTDSWMIYRSTWAARNTRRSPPRSFW